MESIVEGKCSFVKLFWTRLLFFRIALLQHILKLILSYVTYKINSLCFVVLPHSCVTTQLSTYTECSICLFSHVSCGVLSTANTDSLETSWRWDISKVFTLLVLHMHQAFFQLCTCVVKCTWWGLLEPCGFFFLNLCHMSLQYSTCAAVFCELYSHQHKFLCAYMEDDRNVDLWPSWVLLCTLIQVFLIQPLHSQWCMEHILHISSPS